MWDRNYFSHDIPNPPGGKVFDEIKRRGICYTVAGENIGRNNYPDDQSTQVNVQRLDELVHGQARSSSARASTASASGRSRAPARLPE